MTMKHVRRLKAGILPVAAAGILCAGLLWGALADRKSSMPEGWMPVNDRVEASLADLASRQVSEEDRVKNRAQERTDREGAEAAVEGKGDGASVAAAGEENTAGGDGLDAEGEGDSGGVEGVEEVQGVRGSEGAGSAYGAESAEGLDVAGDAGGGIEAGSADKEEMSGKLDLNAADAEELDALPGIGPAKAQAIIEDRNANGPYETVEQLTRVKGIGEKLLDKLKPHVRAGR